MLSVIVLDIVMLSVIMLNVVVLSVVMLSVAEPCWALGKCFGPLFKKMGELLVTLAKSFIGPAPVTKNELS